MKQLWLTARLDIVESLRARWFLIYTGVFGGIVALLFLFGLIHGRIAPEVAVSIALANPLQVFRTAALTLFDPQPIVLGPSAYVILDTFGVPGYTLFALVYPGVLGLMAAGLGYLIFRRGDPHDPSPALPVVGCRRVCRPRPGWRTTVRRHLARHQ